MIVPAAVLVIAALSLAFLPHLGSAVQSAAVRFEDQPAYNAAVLTGAPASHPVAPAPVGPTAITASDVLTGAGSAIGALLVALAALYWRRLPLLRLGFEPGAGLVRAIQGFQSGVVNDYVTWIVIGVACTGGALAFAIR